MDTAQPGDWVQVRFSTPLDSREREGRVLDAAGATICVRLQGHRRRGSPVHTIHENDIHTLRVRNGGRWRRALRRLLRENLAVLSPWW